MNDPDVLVELVDDGTLDTVTLSTCRRCGVHWESRFNSDYVQRHDDGRITDESWKEIQDDWMTNDHSCKPREKQ
jgi:hypothetical protein